MLIGVEYNENYNQIIASYYNDKGKIDFITKDLQESDLFNWYDSPEETLVKRWDDKSVKKGRSTHLSRLRLEELMSEKMSDDDLSNLYSSNVPKIFYLDIETNASEDNEFPDPMEAKFPINTLSLVYDNNILTLSTLKDFSSDEQDNLVNDITKYFKKGNINISYKFVYKYCNTEKQLLEIFFYKILPGISFLTGWNVIEFDWLTLINRAHINDIGITNSLRSKTVMTRFKIPIHMGFVDYLDIFRKIKPFKIVENYTLDYISERVLKISKLKHGYSTFYEFVKDHFEFVKYNIIDTILVQLIEREMNLLEVAFEISRRSKLEINKIFSPVFVTELFMCREFLKQGKKMPVKKITNIDDSTYKGAYVKEPIPGYYKNVGGLDFSSMYPNLQMQFNISPDTYLGKKHEIELDKIDLSKVTITKNDTVFSIEKDSVARRILGDYYQQRKDIKKEMKEKKKLLKSME